MITTALCLIAIHSGFGVNASVTCDASNGIVRIYAGDSPSRDGRIEFDGVLYCMKTLKGNMLEPVRALYYQDKGKNIVAFEDGFERGENMSCWFALKEDVK